jgi:pyruvate dehydrogenase E2 component (dihydrolipoamide acetyltransferase)
MSIEPIVMPKWGLAMEEGTLTKWSVSPGQAVSKGQEIADIETTKIANAFESPATGTVRRLVAPEGQTLPVGALLAVVAEPSVPDAEVDAYVEKFLAEFKPPEKKGGGGPDTRTVEAGGLSVRTLAAGEGEGTPVLLVHGFGSDLMSWLFNQEALAQGRKAYAFDLPGHGGTSKAVQDAGVAGLARSTLAVMDALGLEKAHLVGHSLGGAVALQVALTAPGRVASASLIAPAGLGPDINIAFIEGFIGESRSRKLRGVLQELVVDPGLISADMVEEVLKFKRLDGAEDALRAIAEANFGGGTQKTILRDKLSGSLPPVTVIFGVEDRIIPARHADGLPGSVKVVRIEGAGHIPHMEKSADVNQAIQDTIAKAEA